MGAFDLAVGERHDDAMAQQRILVAMSSGVDSSVAAALLREQGHECIGVTLHLWDATGEQKVGRCCAPEDRDDARKTCEAIGIPHYVIDERAAFREHVVDPFVRGYAGGATPSPCVTCNQHVKLGRLAELADALGCASIATGHYARIVLADGRVELLRGVDASKDQSYFLFGVPRAILARLVLPLGGLDKGRTREEGRRLGVPNWDKKDSQELCFVPDGNVGSFVEREGVAPRAGQLLGTDGEVVGQHGGVHHFTVGQRRGLGLGGGPPRYVLRVVPETAEVVVGDEAGLYAAGLEASSARWIDDHADETFDAEIQVRHHHRPAPARIERRGDGFVARFSEPQRAIAPGQAAVVYVGPRVLGGGTIATAL